MCVHTVYVGTCMYVSRLYSVYEVERGHKVDEELGEYVPQCTEYGIQ